MQSTVYMASIWYETKYQRETAAWEVLLHTQTHSPLMRNKKSVWSKTTWSCCSLRCELILHGNNLASHSSSIFIPYPQQWFCSGVYSQFVIQNHSANQPNCGRALFPTMIISQCLSGKIIEGSCLCSKIMSNSTTCQSCFSQLKIFFSVILQMA